MSLGPSFDSILDAARAGADWAWTTLYRELAPGVLGYLRARGAGDPEDLLGECFLQVVRDLRRFEGDEDDLRAWVFTIAHHRLIDEARARARRPSIPVPHDELHAAIPAGDAEADAVATLTQTEIRTMIETLAPDQQAVLLLRILGDLSIPEIARIVGKRPGAVKALQRRGLAAIRRRLLPQEPPA